MNTDVTLMSWRYDVMVMSTLTCVVEIKSIAAQRHWQHPLRTAPWLSTVHDIFAYTDADFVTRTKNYSGHAVVLQSCVNCVRSANLFRTVVDVSDTCRRTGRGLITATTSWLDCQDILFVDFSPCWIPSFDLSIKACISVISLHWLRAHEPINYKLAVLRLNSLNVTDGSSYVLLTCLTVVLFVVESKLTTIGDHCFTAADPAAWNHLSNDVTSSPSIIIFRIALLNHYLYI